MEIKLGMKCWGLGDQASKAGDLGRARRCGGLDALSFLNQDGFVQCLTQKTLLISLK